MNIEQLPSGSYRVRKQIEGKRYTFVFDHKPTQKEIFKAFDDREKEIRQNATLSFKGAAETLIASKTNVASPSTIKTYKTKLKVFPEWFLDKPIDDIRNADVQKVVNELSLDRSPKTVKDYYSIIKSTLDSYEPDLKLKIKLPMIVQKADPYIPTPEDVKAILEHDKGTKWEVVEMLGCYGLRIEEACAITMDDIDFNTGDIRIDKALVKNDENKFIISKTKTAKSTRTIRVDSRVLEAIQTNGLYDGYPNSVSRHLGIVEKELGITYFTYHKLRHYFASQAHAAGIPDADIMAFGGWETDNIMKTVYRHATKSADVVSDSISQGLFG